MAGPNQSRTRKQIRQSIGVSLKAIDLDAGTITRAPAETSSAKSFIYDNAVAFGAVNDYRGKWVIATDSGGTTETRRILSSDPNARVFEVSVPFSNTPDTDWEFEVWDEDVSPVSVHEYINNAIMEVNLASAVKFDSDSMHYTSAVKEYPLASSFSGVINVSYRTGVKGKQLVSYNDAPSTLSSNTSISSDTAHYREGTAAAKISISASESASTDIAGSSFDSTDISGYDTLELWVNSNVATDTAQLVVKLMNGSSVRESLVVPALNADSYTHVQLSLNNPEIDTDITAVRISTDSSGGSSRTVNIDNLRAIRAQSGKYEPVHDRLWSLNQSDRSIVFSENMSIPASKLRVTGTKNPSLLSSDSAASDVPAEFIKNSAIAEHLRATASRSGENIDASFEQSIRFESLAQAERYRIHAPNNVKWLDG